MVLASGDPLFYGVARYLCDKLGKDRFEVLPHVSSMQLAFARVKESWEEAYLTDLANRPLDQVLEKIRSATKVGLFTSEAVAAEGRRQGACSSGRIDYFSAYVCENLGSPDERVTQGELAEIAATGLFAAERDDPGAPARRAGSAQRSRSATGCSAIRTRRFLQSKPKQGLLTPAEVRSMALAELDLGPTSIVWDIGAGSGSVAIEAAQIARGGTVYAIEMDPQDHELIIDQRRAIRRDKPGAGAGPGADAWEDLPDADAIFVGGSGREISRIVELAYAAVASRRAAGGQRGQHRESVGRARSAGSAGQGRERVDDQRRPRNVPTGTRAVRGLESHVSVGRGEVERQARARERTPSERQRLSAA